MDDGTTADPDRVLAAAAALRRAQRDGRLDALCERAGVEVLTLHGSVARGASEPHDLDLAVLLPDAAGDLLTLREALVALVGIEAVDLLDLRHASVVARARGLGHGAEPLYEATPGAYARAQIAASSLEMDFAHLRRQQLELLAGR